MAFAAVVPGFAQPDLGKSCGCPPVASRTVTVNLSTLAVSGGASDGELVANNVILTCDKMWKLDKKIYVTNGKSLTIQPGTVIKGMPSPGGDAAQATALIVERGGKIFASGAPDCQIVFTADADPMDNSYGVAHHGDWGGVVILGKATNNLTLANATAAFGGTCTGTSCFGTGAGTGFIEGFTAADSRNQYGGTDDDDNSGIFKYVSIRHAGAIVAANGNELNGLSLGSVGRGTTLEHIEVISSNDDGIEFFGGTVNLKYAAVMFGMDDMFDWDQGWRGKAQFLFGFAADSVTTPTADNGFEADNDDQKTNATPAAHPLIYNATIIGNGSKNQNISDNSAHAAINAKELTQGEIYSSVFGNFATGFNMQKSFAAPRTQEAYANWATDGTLKVGCNTFVGNMNDLRLDKSKTSNGVAPSGTDMTKFSGDGNVTVVSPSGVPSFDMVLTMNTANNMVTHQYDMTPFPPLTIPALPSPCVPPMDGFFSEANYRGAFSSVGKSWLSNWAYAAMIAASLDANNCPTDITGDGQTTQADLSAVGGAFGTKCK